MAAHAQLPCMHHVWFTTMCNTFSHCYLVLVVAARTQNDRGRCAHVRATPVPYEGPECAVPTVTRYKSAHRCRSGHVP